MKLKELLNQRWVQCEMEGTTRDEVLAELAGPVCRDLDLPLDEVVAALVAREQTESTAVVPGVAFPHARLLGVKDVSVAMGVSRQGIDFGGPIGQPVKLLVMFLVPVRSTVKYLQAMAAFMKVFEKEGSLERILAGDDARKMVNLVAGIPVEVRKGLVAADIMRTEVVTVNPGATLVEVVDVLFKNRVSGAVVVDEGGEVVGEVSEAEVIRAGLLDYASIIGNLAILSEVEPFENLLRRGEEIKAGDIMKRQMVTVTEQSPIVEVASKMVNMNVRRTPVVRGKKLVGLIARQDIIRKVICQ